MVGDEVNTIRAPRTERFAPSGLSQEAAVIGSTTKGDADSVRGAGHENPGGYRGDCLD